MSNNNTRGNTRNTNNSRNTSTTPLSRNQNRDPKKVWVVRPSFTVGDCRVYLTKEDAFKNFGQPEDSWQFIDDYDVDINRNQEGEVWINDKSPSWDADFEVQWTLEEIEVRSLSVPSTPEVKAPVETPKVVTPVTPVTPITPVRDEN